MPSPQAGHLSLFTYHQSPSGLGVLCPAYPGHRSSLTQVHIAIVFDVILQPRGDTRAVSAGRIASRRGVGVTIVLGIPGVFGIPILSGLVAITAMKFVEEEGERERNTPTHISSFSWTYRAKQGADTEEENNNFFHRAATLDLSVAHPGRKRKQQRGKGNDKLQMTNDRLAASSRAWQRSNLSSAICHLSFTELKAR
jgi:hypothetical protein